MNTLAGNLIRQPFAWMVTANVLALAAFVASPHAAEFPLAVIGIQVSILVQLWLPSCRLAWAAPLCPANIAQIFFWVQLVLVPLLMGFYGPSQGTLPRLPSDDMINWVMCLRALAYVSFCLCYACCNGQGEIEETA